MANNTLLFENNFTIGALTFEKLLSLKLTPWAGQRNVNEDVVDELVLSYLGNLKTRGNLLIRHPFYLAKVNDSYQILDGQHRYQALCKIKDSNPGFDVTFKIPVGLIQCEDIKDLETEFLILNWVRPQGKVHMKALENKSKTQPLRKYATSPKQEPTDDLQLIKDAVDLIGEKYSNVCDKTYRPSVNKTFLADTIYEHNIVILLKEKSAEKLASCFTQLNEYYATQSKEYFTNIVAKYETRNKTEKERTEKYVYELQNKHQTKHLLGTFKPKPVFANVWVNDLKSIMDNTD